MKRKIDYKIILSIIFVSLFSILRYFFIKDEIVINSIEISYDLLAYQVADKFLMLIYFPIYIYLLNGEIKKYDNVNYIIRHNKLNTYNVYILKKIIIITIKYVLIILIINWIETISHIKTIFDISLFIKSMVYGINLFLAYLVISYIYICIYNLLNEIFAIIFIILINMLEFLSYTTKVIFNVLNNNFDQINFYNSQLKIMIYFIIFLFILYNINNIILTSTDIKRGKYEK